MPTGIRVLFVEPRAQLTSMIDHFPQDNGQNWAADQAKTALEAFELLETNQYAAVVCGVELPDSEILTFVEQLASKCPDSVRFLLAGELDRELVLKTAGHIHQFVTKPCDPETLGKMISNSLSMRRLLGSQSLHKRVAAIGSLPSPPEVYNSLVEELQSDECSIKKVADLISHDVGITAKMLQIVNSAYFGSRAHVESPFHAVNMLGLDTVQSLVLTAGVFNQFEGGDLPGLSVRSIHDNSVAVGSSARLIATAFGLNRRPTEEALMAGMLHDVGKLVMLTSFRKELKEAVLLAQNNGVPLWEAQKKIIGVSDAEIGAHLLSMWGLPDTILEAVALHYKPTKSPHPIVNVLTTVHIAYALNQENAVKKRNASPTALDMDYLQRLNLTNQIQSIRNLSMAAAV